MSPRPACENTEENNIRIRFTLLVMYDAAPYKLGFITFLITGFLKAF